MKARDRKEASARLGIALQAKYRKMLEATGSDEIQIAAIDLGECFNANIEFICWALKEYGGIKQMPFQPPAKQVSADRGPNDWGVSPLSELPDYLQPPPSGAIPIPDNLHVPAPCTCPVLEAGIIGRDKHMTACPQFQP